MPLGPSQYFVSRHNLHCLYNFLRTHSPLFWNLPCLISPWSHYFNPVPYWYIKFFMPVWDIQLINLLLVFHYVHENSRKALIISFLSFSFFCTFFLLFSSPFYSLFVCFSLLSSLPVWGTVWYSQVKEFRQHKSYLAGQPVTWWCRWLDPKGLMVWLKS